MPTNTTPYATLAALKLSLGITDTVWDTDLNAKLASATLRINEHCGRIGTGFNLDAAPSARVFEARDAEYLTVDDIGSLTGFAVATGQVGSFTNTIALTDFETRPLNAFVIGRPIEVLRHFWAYWPTWPSVRVQVTATWGWPAVPDTVVNACLLQAAHLFRRKDTPDGLANAGDFGPIRVGRVDPDVEDLLTTYARPGFA